MMFTVYFFPKLPDCLRGKSFLFWTERNIKADFSSCMLYPVVVVSYYRDVAKVFRFDHPHKPRKHVQQAYFCQQSFTLNRFDRNWGKKVSSLSRCCILFLVTENENTFFWIGFDVANIEWGNSLTVMWWLISNNWKVSFKTNRGI